VGGGEGGGAPLTKTRIVGGPPPPPGGWGDDEKGTNREKETKVKPPQILNKTQRFTGTEVGRDDGTKRVWTLKGGGEKNKKRSFLFATRQMRQRRERDGVKIDANREHRQSKSTFNQNKIRAGYVLGE